MLRDGCSLRVLLLLASNDMGLSDLGEVRIYFCLEDFDTFSRPS